MSSEARYDDWDVLGLEPGASEHEVQAAYRRRRQLWSGQDVATYSLLLEEEQAEVLERLDEAYQRLLSDVRNRAAPQRKAAAFVAPDTASGDQRPPEVQPPDDVSPGRFLRRRREDLGMTLADISTRTKIRAAILRQLEEETADELPPRVYVRGFVIQVCRCLAVSDPESFARRYLDHVGSS